MAKNTSRVLIIGGLGFIGYHTIVALLKDGFEVSVLARTLQKTPFKNVELIVADLVNLTDSALIDLLKPFDCLIFAGGADDRTFPKGDAATFFYTENVVPVVRLAKLAKETKLQKIIVLGSYFTYFNRTRPEWKLAERHPYIRSRVLQQQESIAAAGKDTKTAIVILELPYIFGAAPNKVPLWQPLVKYIKWSPIIFYPVGGTNVVTVEQVAMAILGVIRHAKHGDCLPIGGENLTWVQLLQGIMTSLGTKKPIVSLPKWSILPFVKLLTWYFAWRGKQSGLDLYHFMTVQTTNTWFDASEKMHYLQVNTTQDLRQAFDDTVKASLEISQISL